MTFPKSFQVAGETARRNADVQGDGPLAFLPIWGIFIGTLLLVLLSVEGGYRWARYKQKRSEQEKEAPVSAMVGSLTARRRLREQLSSRNSLRCAGTPRRCSIGDSSSVEILGMELCPREHCHSQGGHTLRLQAYRHRYPGFFAWEKPLLSSF